MNDIVVRIVRYRKSCEDKFSSEKFVAGVIVWTKASWALVKSAMLFWRSRMLRKKSFDVSLAGFMTVAGAKAGPVYA